MTRASWLCEPSGPSTAMEYEAEVYRGCLDGQSAGRVSAGVSTGQTAGLGLPGRSEAPLQVLRGDVEPAVERDKERRDGMDAGCGCSGVTRTDRAVT